MFCIFQFQECKFLQFSVVYLDLYEAILQSLSRLLYLAFSANLGLLCMPHPGMGPLV